jgi:Holliday junction resolvasome RuvABC endonuclease subunit
MDKNKPKNICAIDASTNTIAFAIFSDDRIHATGKVAFFGHNIYEKIIDATAKTRAFFRLYEIDAVVIEHTVFMNSPKTAADLAMVQGAIIGGIGLTGINQIGRVSPITWQNYLGNKKLTKEEQLAIRSSNPGKSDSWYKSYERNIRKERTINLIDIIYDKKIDDNDVADACGIGHWAIHNWEKAVSYA